MYSIRGKKRCKWSCPTDRELALRAKLNSGWSVHSQEVFKKSDPILEPELRYIKDVIERARHIDLLEKERIEKMVCRLQNMRRNAVGDGDRSCFMCGSAFGRLLLGNTRFKCDDCSKAVCEKCRIDTTFYSQDVCLLCKICAENREVWKKSGGWFYGEVPVVVNCSATFNTWEHTKQDIVRLESFEPPEENYNETPLYKNWAVNSSPDLTSLEGEISLLVSNDESGRSRPDSEEELEMFHLSPVDESSSKLSASCPSLPQEISAIPHKAEVSRHRHFFSRKKFFSPAQRAMAKVSSKKRKG